MAKKNKNRGMTEMVLAEGTDAVIVHHGVKVLFNAEGVAVYDGSVRVYPAKDEAAQPQAMTGPQVGDRMEDGTIFAGISPDTNKPMYALPEDAPLSAKWEQAMEYAAKFEGYGHPEGTFRTPTKGELDILAQNRTKIGGFNETGLSPGGWYWSSTGHPADEDLVYSQRFGDGYLDYRGCHRKHFEASLRLVRS